MYNTHKNNFMRQSTLVLTLALALTFGLAAPLLFAQSSESTSSAPSTEVNAEATSTEKEIFTSTQDRDNALLALALPKEIQWLETPSEKIIALFKAGEARKKNGTVMILHAPEIPQLWPAVLENLRRNLPLYGWDTLSVPLPTLHVVNGLNNNKSSEENNSSESAASSSTPTSSADSSTSTSSGSTSEPLGPISTPAEQEKNSVRARLIAERVNAAIALLNKIGQPNLAVVVDNSSAPDSLLTLDKKNLRALVLINLQQQEPLSQSQLIAIFSEEELPIMDVFFTPDDRDQKEVRRIHQAEAMRKNLKDYQQLVLPPETLVTVDNPQNFWLDKVRGFIKKKNDRKEK